MWRFSFFSQIDPFMITSKSDLNAVLDPGLDDDYNKKDTNILLYAKLFRKFNTKFDLLDKFEHPKWVVLKQIVSAWVWCRFPAIKS